MILIQLPITEINIKIEIATAAVIKNDLKYFPVSEDNTGMAEAKLEVLL